MTHVTIIPATSTHRPQLVTFLRSAFYKHEPLNVSLGLADTPSDEDINYTLEHLPQGHSLLAVDPSGRILGVAVNSVVSDNEASLRKQRHDVCENQHFKKFLAFWTHVETEADFWRRVDVKSAFSVDVLAVDAEARGKGLGKQLIDRSMLRAKEVEQLVVRMDCSSYFAAKLAEKQGMECVWQVKYGEYRDEKGRVVFEIQAPHEALKVYMQRL